MKKSYIISPAIVFSLLVLFATTTAAAQQHNLHYKLIKGKDTVGELRVVDTRFMTRRIIQTDLKAEVPALVFHFSLVDQKSAVYNDQVLQSAVVTRSFLNAHPDRSITLLKNNIYTDGSNRITALTERPVIDFSMTMLYTTEPEGKQVVYSEFHQVFVAVEQIARHTYRIITPEGQIGDYYYKNGLCIKIETKTTWATISTVLINNTIALK